MDVQEQRHVEGTFGPRKDRRRKPAKNDGEEYQPKGQEAALTALPHRRHTNQPVSLPDHGSMAGAGRAFESEKGEKQKFAEAAALRFVKRRRDAFVTARRGLAAVVSSRALEPG